MMKVRRIIGGFFCFLFLWYSMGNIMLSAEEQGEIALYATAAVLMDAQSGRVLYGKNADTPMAMASTTKIMTCIVVLEEGNLEDTVQVSAYAASMPKVKLYIKRGEEYKLKDLLYSLMLESHNDAAVALAEHIGKQYLNTELKEKNVSDYTVEESKQAVAAFAALMNHKAEEIGCKDTYFITPNGLDATETITLGEGQVEQKEHHTTAEELAKIMSYCILRSGAKEEFLTITRTPSYSFQTKDRSFSCNNHNAFLQMMEGALTGKTGFTNKAGYCYVGALQRDGRTFVVALLACGWPNHKSYKWSDTKELMEYGVDNFFYRSFLEKGIRFEDGLLQPIPVEGGCNGRLGEVPCVQVAVMGENDIVRTRADDENSLDGVLMRADERVQVEYEIEKRLTAPIKRGTIVGNVYYRVGDTIYRIDEIITTDDVEKITFVWCIQQIWERYAL